MQIKIRESSEEGIAVSIFRLVKVLEIYIKSNQKSNLYFAQMQDKSCT